MSMTFVISYLLSAFLLLSQNKPEQAPQSAAAQTTPRSELGKMVRVTYAVADLVVPIGQDLCKNREGMGKLNNSLPEKGCERKRKGTTEARLMKLIRTTVEPASWSENGGSGTMTYYPLGMGLVVHNTRDVQEQVADLLVALRRLQELEVAVEIRLVSVSESFVERIGVDFNINLNTAASTDNARPGTTVVKEPESSCLSKLKGLAFLDDKQLYQFMEAAQGDRRTNIMQTPKVTVFNGQKANVEATQQQYFVTDLKVVREGDQVIVVPKNEVFTTGVRFTVQPVVSADRRFVLMKFKANLTDLESGAVPMMPVTTHLIAKTGEEGQEHVVPVQQFVQQPVLRTMTVDKSFQVADGKTAVLCWGQRPTECRTEYDARPPVLSKIPYVNRLFKNVGYGREAETLLLLITPRIIINEAEEQVFLGQLPLPR